MKYGNLCHFIIKSENNRNVLKITAPKQHRAPPPPPVQVHRASAPNTLHSLNTSSGNKQWQHNATSLAC